MEQLRHSEKPRTPEAARALKHFLLMLLVMSALAFERNSEVQAQDTQTQRVIIRGLENLYNSAETCTVAVVSNNGEIQLHNIDNAEHSFELQTSSDNPGSIVFVGNGFENFCVRPDEFSQMGAAHCDFVPETQTVEAETLWGACQDKQTALLQIFPAENDLTLDFAASLAEQNPAVRPVRVYVIDTSIDGQIPGIIEQRSNGRLGAGASFLPDVPVYDDTDVTGPLDNIHATAVSSIIRQRGAAGTVIPLTVYGFAGHLNDVTPIAEAVEHASSDCQTARQTEPETVCIINLSSVQEIDGDKPHRLSLEQLEANLAEFRSNGGLVVRSSGNDTLTYCLEGFAPANADLFVGAARNNGTPEDYSLMPCREETPFILAPTNLPVRLLEYNILFSGTSASAPYITGRLMELAATTNIPADELVDTLLAEAEVTGEGWLLEP